jgi:hypothetical protein
MCAIVFVFFFKKKKCLLYIVPSTKYHMYQRIILCYYVSLAIRYIHGDIVSCVVKT